MKKKSLLPGIMSVCLVLLTKLPVSGQGFLINAVRTLELRSASENKKYGDLDGSPYYTSGFTKSTAYLKNGNYANIPLRYDMFRDEMEFQKDGKILWLFKKDIKFIKYGTEIIVVTTTGGDTTKPGYYFLKDSGKFQLFYKKSVQVELYVQPKGYAGSKPDRFESVADEIYISKGNESAVKIETNKDLQSFFKGDKVALDFIKKNRIKADDIINLHLLIGYLNGL